MENPASLPEVVAWVGLDWADERHQISLQAVGEPQAQSLTVEQKPEALQAWIAQLRARFPRGSIAVALEQSRGAVMAALMNYDFLLLYPLQPKTLARYREAFISSRAKSDARDADLLLELVRAYRDRLRVWQPDDALTRQLRLLVEHRRRTVAERTRLSNRLTALLKTYFPQALEWAGDWRTVAGCDFLQAWPSLPDLAAGPPLGAGAVLSAASPALDRGAGPTPAPDPAGAAADPGSGLGRGFGADGPDPGGANAGGDRRHRPPRRAN